MTKNQLSFFTSCATYCLFTLAPVFNITATSPDDQYFDKKVETKKQEERDDEKKQFIRDDEERDRQNREFIRKKEDKEADRKRGN